MTPPKGYKHTELGILPQDWEVVRLGEVCEIQSGGTPSRNVKEYWENGTIRWLGSSVCKNQKFIDEITDFITEKGLQKSSAKIFPKGTTLIALVGATIGKVAFLQFDASTNQNIAGIQPNKAVANEDFIFYISLMLYRYFENLSSDKFKMANLSFVKNLQIPLPPLAEQEKIAEILSTWDTQIQNYESLIKEKQTLKKGLCQTLFTAKTRPRGFSEDWEVVRLGEVCEILAGGDVPKHSFSKVKTEQYQIPILSNGIGEKALYGFTNQAKIQEPCVTISARGTIGYCSLQTKPFYPVVRLIVVIPKTELNPRFLCYATIFVNIEGTKSGIPQLTIPMVKNLQIPLPPLAEQEKIAKIFSEADNEIMLLEQKIESLKSQKKGIMQKLLNGKVRVKI